MRICNWLIILLFFLSGFLLVKEMPFTIGAMSIPTVEIIFEDELIHADISGNENVS